MQVLNFIIKNILTQAAVVVGLIALLGLVLQKKPIGTVVSGTMKTILGFLVLSRDHELFLVICLIRLLDLRVL